MNIAHELVRAAKQILAGDEWMDEKTYAFAKEVANVIRRDREYKVTSVKDNKIYFVHSPNLLVSVPLVLELMEFGYDKSESVNGTIRSEKVTNFRIPGGYTTTRNPKELWDKAKETLRDILNEAGV